LPPSIARPPSAPNRWSTPLLVQGRIFLSQCLCLALAPFGPICRRITESTRRIGRCDEFTIKPKPIASGVLHKIDKQDDSLSRQQRSTPPTSDPLGVLYAESEYRPRACQGTTWLILVDCKGGSGTTEGTPSQPLAQRQGLRWRDQRRPFSMSIWTLFTRLWSSAIDPSCAACRSSCQQDRISRYTKFASVKGRSAFPRVAR
jgi:hypothetical protein